MPRGFHARGGLRSHRRRLGKHLIVAPWIIITTVAVVLFAGLSVGYVYLITRGCKGSPVTATIAADTSISKTLDQLGRQWVNTGPSLQGRCVSVQVVTKDSAETAAALSPNWDPRTDGQRPDVWVPESSSWMLLAKSRADAQRMIPDRQPSLTRSPVVLAMPQPMADALGRTKITWHDLVTSRFAGMNWSTHGHPEWGAFKLAMPDPAGSTAALNALLAIADANNDGQISATERQAVSDLWNDSDQKLYKEQNAPDDITQGLITLEQSDAKSSQILQHVSAFPALEQDVVSYNQDDAPSVPLKAVYPSDGAADADFPYLVLNWSHATMTAPAAAAQRQRDNVANAFLTYLRTPASRATFLDNGYRDSNFKGGADLVSGNGVARTISTLPRSVMWPTSISQSVAMWSALTRPTNILLVVDVSDGMGDTVPGTGKTKAALVCGAAADAVKLLGPQARVGLWGFASGLGNGKGYSQLVSPGPLTGTRADIVGDLTDLQTGGKLSLYDTAAAAYTAMRQHYQTGAANEIVIVTGGGTDRSATLDLNGLTAQLKKTANRDQPLPIITIGYGNQAQLSSLQAISSATGGRAYVSDTPSDLGNVMQTALFGSTPPTS
jgi:Ca-activated chloride channel family protein